MTTGYFIHAGIFILPVSYTLCSLLKEVFVFFVIQCQSPLALSMCRRQNLSVGVQGPDIAPGLVAEQVWPSASGATHAAISLEQSERDASCDTTGRAQAVNSTSLLICITKTHYSGSRMHVTTLGFNSWIHENLRSVAQPPSCDAAAQLMPSIAAVRRTNRRIPPL